jgi:predicted NBD/HSP70 family sugar kinase
VLTTLFHVGPQSRADLARSTGLTRVTISELIAQLVEEGMVQDHGMQPEGRIGKPGSPLGLVPGAGNIIAVDLANTTTAHGAVFNLTGQTIAKRSLPMVGATGQVAQRVVYSLLDELLPLCPGRVTGIGVASPGVVGADGVVLTAPNFAWTNLPLGQQIAERYDVPSHVGNDANLAARAEFTFGNAGSQGMMIVTVGRGLGAGILLDGVLLQGPDFAAGEIGHVTAIDDGPKCGCGRRGCLETVLSLPPIETAMAQNDRDQRLAEIGTTAARVLAPIVSAFNLRELVFASSAGPLPKPLLDAIAAAVMQRVLPTNAANLIVRNTNLGREAVLLGASALVLREEVGIG